MLLPAFHAVQDRVGWVSRGALNYICQRLVVPPAEAWGVLTFYHLFATEPRARTVAHVCDDIACRAQGGEALCRELEAAIGPPGALSALAGGAWQRSPCLGQCERAPAVMVVAAGDPLVRTVVAPARSATEVVGAMATPAARGVRESLAELRHGVPQAGAARSHTAAARGRGGPVES